MYPEPIILSHQPSVLDAYLAEIRDAVIQQDRQRFRTNVRRAGHVLAYELSKLLSYSQEAITTPLGEASVPTLDTQPVLGAILRAGLGLQAGFLDAFDHADTAFVSAYRKPTRGEEFTIEVEYISAPSLEGRTLILLDPMIATGRSMIRSYEALTNHGEPDQVFLVALIASEEGLVQVREELPEAQLVVGAVDPELTASAYIVPGLGDAGDLLFGPKETPAPNGESATEEETDPAEEA